jgi:hypothetical protein
MSLTLLRISARQLNLKLSLVGAVSNELVRTRGAAEHVGAARQAERQRTHNRRLA